MSFPQGATSILDPVLGLALGIWPGQSAGLVSGYTATSATSAKTVRATGYTPQGTNAQRSIKSTNANDTAAGTGAQEITIIYLSVDMLTYKTAVVVPAGLTAVPTGPSDIALIERAWVSKSGSGGGNAGTINIFTDNAGAGSIWGSIATGDNQTYWAHHYVLSGQTCYVKALVGMASVTNGALTINQVGTPTASPNTSPQLPVGSTYVHGNQTTTSAPPVDHAFGAPPGVAGPAIIFINETPIAVTASTTWASFEYIQI